MEIVSTCPLPVASVVWRTRAGGVSLTVVCKATYDLRPVESPLADEQDPIDELDLVPFKRRADVLLAGHAHAPRGEPARSIVARLAVGDVDKSVEVSADRAFSLEGRLDRRPMAPELLRWNEHPLPDNLDPAHFNAAPADQRVDSIRPDERLVLENLHPEHARLATNLAVAAPRATVEWPGRGAEDIRFRCDTLWIDTDRCRCTLTWRTQIPLDHADQPGRVTVKLAQVGREPPKLPPRMEPKIERTLDAPVAGAMPVLPFRVGRSPLAGSVLGSPAARVDRSALPFVSPIVDEDTIDGDTVDTEPAGLALIPIPALVPIPIPLSAPIPIPILDPIPSIPLSAPIPLLVPAPEPPGQPSPPSLPLSRYPLPRCAKIAASCARRKPDTAAILVEHELSPEIWAAFDKHWADAIRDESRRGKKTLLTAYDAAYVAQLEEERGPLTAREYARLVIALERGRADAVLTELTLPKGAILRIQRVWLDRIAADAAFGKSVRAAMAAETEREE